MVNYTRRSIMFATSNVYVDRVRYFICVIKAELSKSSQVDLIDLAEKVWGLYSALVNLYKRQEVRFWGHKIEVVKEMLRNLLVDRNLKRKLRKLCGGYDNFVRNLYEVCHKYFYGSCSYDEYYIREFIRLAVEIAEFLARQIGLSFSC